MFTTAVVGLAEWIIDDTYLVLCYVFSKCKYLLRGQIIAQLFIQMSL